ncbi:unnamed protein product [Effrenium voratum]|nr:unnamed protein product [Effrenium voratum]
MDRVSGYGALCCHARWQRLQQLREERGLDAIIIAVGPDASFSRSNEAAFNWLLLGLSGQELLNSLPGAYNECLVCVGKEHSCIFCTAAMREELGTRTALWDTVLVMGEEGDADSYEAQKVAVFVNMVKDCKKLGVFCEPTEDLKMTVEKWPVVQAFGYDEFGQGFLTLRRELVNLEQDMHQVVYPAWDLTAMQWAQQLFPKFQRAWEDAIAFHDQHSRAEAVAAAPLVDYYLYGKDEDCVAVNPAPRLLVGKDTAKILQPAVPGQAMADDPSAQHMVWEAVDPLTGIAATRSYCLALENETLLRSYACCAKLCRLLLAGHAVEDAKRQVWDLPESPQIFQTDVDAMGRPCDAKQRGPLHLRFFRVACNLGADGFVAFGDCAFAGADGEAALLGAEVPSLAVWAGTSAKEEARSQAVQAGLEEVMGLNLDWGRSVALGHRKDVRVYLDPPDQPPDPLQLGEDPLDVEVSCHVAVGLDGLLGLAACRAWTYGSGKAVIFGPRFQYLLLSLRDARHTLEAPDGQLWVAMELELSCGPLQLALSVSPSCLSAWRQLEQGEADLSWLQPAKIETMEPSVSSLCGLVPSPAPALHSAPKLVLVTGLPGCGAMDVAKSLAMSLRSGPVVDGHRFENLAELPGLAQTDQEWLVLCDVMRDPQELQALQPWTLCVLDAAVAGDALLRRLVRRRAALQTAQAVAVRSQEHRSLSALLMKELQSARAGVQVFLRPLTSQLLEALGTENTSPVLPVAKPGDMVRIFVPSPTAALDLQLLRRSLQQKLQAASSWSSLTTSPWHGLFCVEVKAPGASSAAAFWERPEAKEQRLLLTPRGELSAPQHWQEPLASTSGAVFWFAADAAEVSVLQKLCAGELAQCALQVPEERPWDLQTVPLEARLELQEQLRQRGPPPGYSFDGVRYINQEDYSTSKEHPEEGACLAQLVEQHNLQLAQRCRKAQEVLAGPRSCSPMRPPGNAAGRPPRPRAGYVQ